MYCSGCGYNLNGNENFCPDCGKGTSSDAPMQENNSEKESFSTLEFSSNFLLGGNILTPDKIVITNTEVIYRKRNKYLIGVDESSIPFSRISSVEIDRKLIDSDIVIYSTGNQKLIAGDFTISNAKKIKAEIERRMNR